MTGGGKKKNTRTILAPEGGVLGKRGNHLLQQILLRKREKTHNASEQRCGREERSVSRKKKVRKRRVSLCEKSMSFVIPLKKGEPCPLLEGRTYFIVLREGNRLFSTSSWDQERVFLLSRGKSPSLIYLRRKTMEKKNSLLYREKRKKDAFHSHSFFPSSLQEEKGLSLLLSFCGSVREKKRGTRGLTAFDTSSDRCEEKKKKMGSLSLPLSCLLVEERKKGSRARPLFAWLLRGRGKKVAVLLIRWTRGERGSRSFFVSD